MAHQVHSCSVDDSVEEAERLMRAAQVRRLPVVDRDGQLRGMLSLADLAEGAAELRGSARGEREAELAHTLEAICRPRGEVAPTTA